MQVIVRVTLPSERNQHTSPNDDGTFNCSSTYPLKVPSASLWCKTTVAFGRKCISWRFVAVTEVTHLFATQRATKFSAGDNLQSITSFSHFATELRLVQKMEPDARN